MYQKLLLVTDMQILMIKFEACLKTEIDLVEDDFGLVLDEYISSFITDEIEPGIYTFNDLSQTVSRILQPEGYHCVTDIEFDDITMKTKLVIRLNDLAKRFDEKSFFNTFLGLTAGWDYEHCNVYISKNNTSLSSTKKIQLKCGVIDRSILDDSRQPILFSFVLDKPSGYKVFCEPETIHY